MRSIILCLAVILISLSCVNAQSAPPNPQTPAEIAGTDTMCELETLALNNGLSLSTPFSPTIFTYGCSCADWSQIGSGAGSPEVIISTIDPGSDAQVWFNGQPINTAGLSNSLTNTAGISNPLATTGNTWQPGNNLIQILVGCHSEDDSCQYEYIINCNNPSQPGQGGFVVGDPQFIGLRGQNYQIHGVSGEIYNIVSDADLQYNSRFVFLSQGDCPVLNGKKQKGCWSHPGSYLGELGLKTKNGDKIHFVSGDAKEGFDTVEINGKSIEIGETVFLDNGGSLSLNSTHLASVQIGNWDFAFENSDMFINQRVRVLDSRTLRSHGLLGQTWRETTYPNSIKHIQGTVDDYVVKDNDIFGDNFVFNTYN